MKFKAIITQRDGTKIFIDLNCREYHAQKLNYVLSRTLDRALYIDAAVVACDEMDADTMPAKATRRKRAPLLDLSTIKKVTRG